MTRVILGLMRGDGILEGNESLIMDISVIINENWWRGGGRSCSWSWSLRRGGGGASQDLRVKCRGRTRAVCRAFAVSTGAVCRSVGGDS